MKSDEENEKDPIEKEVEKAEKLGLSDEAKLSPEEKKQMKKLDENRFLISTEPTEKKEDQNTSRSTQRKVITPGKEKEESEAEKEKEIKKENNPLKKPRNLVKLLSTYNVSLNSPVKTLIKRIKKKGKEHLEKELKDLQ